MSLLRLDKIISACGIASRKEIKQMARLGRIKINGKAVTEADAKFDPDIVKIEIDGTIVNYKSRHILMLNKPAGVITATEDRSERTVLNLVSDEYRKIGLFPVGRLDKDTEGFLLMTDDGDFCHNVISPSKEVGKIYYARVAGSLSSQDINAFRKGILLRDGQECLPADLKIKTTGEESTCFVLVYEGKYHQVKRMLAALGKPVTYLKREAIGGVRLDEALPTGEFRELTENEASDIFKKEKMKAVFESI